MTRPAERFLRARLERMIDSASSILDIGGGMRIDETRSNRVEEKLAWARDRMEARGVAYRVLDYVDTYHPDVVGDIQQLPLATESEEAIVCISVLEHVEDPHQAARELYRVLKPGGQCLIYVPFLFYYHAEKGYYGDYWRFTEDTLHLLFGTFARFELCTARGAIETLIRVSPLGRSRRMCDIGYVADRLFRKTTSKQTSGYFLFLEK